MDPVRDAVAVVTAALGDRYAIDRELGRGGMATVYVAQDRRHAREVAIKVLRPDVAAAIGAERFLREIAIAARLTHPHVLPLIDSGQAAGSRARAVMAQHLSEAPPPLRARRPDAPAAVEQALARALAKDPADRFATVAQFVAALEATDAPGAAPALVGKTRSLAVLPFVNGSADPENEYLCDGVTDELINALTKVEGLRIASRTSVFALKGKPQDIRAIGALLGVSAVLEGTVRKADDRLRITVQLAAADDGRTLWSERYDRRLDDVFAVHDEIARTIVSTLRTTFLADLADPTPRRYTDNVQAYSLYLKGRFCWNKRSQEGVREAIAYFEQAIDHDPGYALAYSGLSDSYGLQVDYRGVPVTEGYKLARRYALKALELDDTLPEAHTSLAWVQFAYDWDWAAAERSYRRALELNPGYATGHHWYSFVLLVTGQADQALVEAHTALELDPSSLSIRRGLGWLYYYTRRYESAVYHLRRAIAMNPTSEDTYRILGLVLTQQGAYDEAERAFREAITLSPELSYAPAGAAHVLALRGRRREAEALLAQLEARARDHYVSPVAFCIVHLGLRNTDQVFTWLERAYQDRRGWLAYLKVDPMLDVVEDDPRFAEFVKRMKL